MTLDPMQLPDDIATLKAMLIATAKRAHDAETRASTLDAEIENLKLTIAKLQHDKFGTSSERARLLDQLELQLAELEEQVAQNAATDEIAALPAGSQSEPGAVSKPPRRRPARRPLPAHLPRERIIYPPSEVCPCCSGTNFRKLGTDETESLERVPAQWKVVVHVREKFACRKCDTIVQAPAPSHPVSRGRAGPHLLAEIVFGKYRAHQPLNRQSDIYANEGVDIDISTMADWVGACAATLMPIRDAIEKHVHAGERIHIDDTTVPVLAKGKCLTAACGPMCGTTVRLPAQRLRLPCSTTRPIAKVNTQSSSSRPTLVSCRPTPIRASTASIGKTASRGRSLKPDVGLIFGASCSSWHGCARRQSPSKPFAASTNCSPSNETPTDNRLNGVWRSAASDPNLVSTSWKNGCAKNARSCPRTIRSPRRWITV